jgi:predicted metal-dependent peptidase
VQKVETYSSGQPVQLNPVGGGGTEFGPCFDWLDEHGIQPQTLVFLTDLYGSFPPSAPAGHLFPRHDPQGKFSFVLLSIDRALTG